MDNELEEVLEDLKPTVDKLFEILIDRLDEKNKTLMTGLANSFELIGLQESLTFKVQTIKTTIDELDQSLKEIFQ